MSDTRTVSLAEDAGGAVVAARPASLPGTRRGVSTRLVSPG